MNSNKKATTTAMQNTYVCRISPAMAADWLQSNTNNRPLRQRHVDSLARDIANGRWTLSPDAISFDRNGVLTNGQHRLAAIIKADRDAEMIVCFGVDPGSFGVTDGGMKRSFADMLAHEGHADSSSLGAIIASVAAWQIAGWPTTLGNVTLPVTRSDLYTRFLLDPAAYVESAKVGARVAKSVGLARSWWGSVYFLMLQIDPVDADSFVERLCTQVDYNGDPLPLTHPAKALRDTIARDMRSGRPAISKNRKLALGLIVKAWNAYRAGEPVKVLKYRAGGDNPERFPDLY